MSAEHENNEVDLVAAKMPRHIAVIMDGNGRWAKMRRQPRIMGHRAGAASVREIIKSCVKLSIPYLTLYAFSQENWKRPKAEINMLMELLDRFIDAECPALIREGVSFKTIGCVEALPEKIQAKLKLLSEKTQACKRLTLIVALNYGSRQEILRACQNVLRKKIADGVSDLKSLEIQEEEFIDCLYTRGIPDPDMLIRTSGEMRLSNFLLWQCSYSEIYISDKLWPDFRYNDLLDAVRAYSERERRFGDVSGKSASGEVARER